MPQSSLSSWSNSEAQFRRTLSPALFPSWQATCTAFGAAMAAGPGLVMLVGGPGSGKTFTFLAYAGGTSKPVCLRSIDDPLKPSVEIDLVDNVDAQAAERLSPFYGTRALAVDHKLAGRLMAVFPGARIVTVRPMLSRDVQAMVELRRPQLGLPVGYVTSKALARMDDLCGGNPRQLDALLFRSLRLAAAAAVARVSIGHVEQAGLQIAREARDNGQDVGSIERDAALRLLGRTGAPTGYAQPKLPRRASTPDFSPSNPVRRPNPQSSPATAARPPGNLAEVPGQAQRPTPLLISARQAGLAHGNSVSGMNPAESVGAGSRRRPRRKTLVMAALAVAASAMPVPNMLELLPWDAEGVQAAFGAVPTMVASLLPSARVRVGVVPSALPIAQPVLPASALPSRGGASPIASRDGLDQTDPMPVDNRLGLAALPVPVVASVLAPVPASSSEMTTPSQAAPPADATSSAEASPRPEPPAGPSHAALAGRMEEADRLFFLGRALLAIHQISDAQLLLKASANMGNSRAAALLAAYDAEAERSRAQTGPAQAERADAPGKQAGQAATKARQSQQP